MKKRFILGSNESFVKSNIYADKSAVVLDWLLRVGIDKEHFSLREVVGQREVSLGLVQKVFSQLVYYGLLQTEGVRTAKKFILKRPGKLIKNWLDHYDIAEKCKMFNYGTGFREKEEILRVLRGSKLSQKVALALHSAADAYRCKNTNFETLELYLFDPSTRQELEKLLKLHPQERSYEVLLIEPYYKKILTQEKPQIGLRISSPLLTFLDLYHFPLRGPEQAEFMVSRIPELKNLFRGFVGV